MTLRPTHPATTGAAASPAGLAGAGVGGAGPAAALFVRRRGGGAAESEAIRRPSISYWQDAWLRLRKNRVAMVSAGYVLVLGLAAAVIPELLPYSYDEQEVWNKHALPTRGDEALVVPDEVPTEAAGDVDAAAAVAAGNDSAVDASADAGGEAVPDGGAVEEIATEPPPSPRGLKLVGTPLTTGVVLAWDPVPGAEGYRVFRSISADTLGVPLDDVAPERPTYRDASSLTADTRFYFVTAFNAFGDSEGPEFVEVTPKLALPLGEAARLDPAAAVGGTVRTRAHYLGTDYMGRDMLARVMSGARISLCIGLVAPLVYILIGIVFGSVSGYVGGRVDAVMMRVCEVVSTIPDLLVVILLQVVLGSGLVTLIIAMVATWWARSAMQIRGEVLRLRETEFVQAAKVLGTPFRKVVARHLLPNVMGTVLVLGTLAVPYAIFSEAFLSFIGLGIKPPLASWGTVTKEGARVFLTYPHELLIPSVLISVTMLAFNLLGDGLRDALDPKLRGAG